MEGFTEFNTDQEYEGGFFGQDGEFYYKNKKPQKKFSKNDAIYGVFNEFDSESEEEVEKSERIKNAKQMINLQKQNKLGMNFKKSDTILYDANKVVSVKQAFNKKSDETLESKPTGDIQNQLKSLFKTSSTQDKIQKKVKQVSFQNDLADKDDTIHSSDDEKQLMDETIQKRIFDFKNKSSKFNQKQLDSNQFGLPTILGKRKQQETVQLKEEPQITNAKDKQMDENYGIGFKMLQKLGYKSGEGLGKDKQGRDAPLEAVYKTQFQSNLENKISKMQKKEEDEISKANASKDSKIVTKKKVNDEDVTVIKRWQKKDHDFNKIFNKKKVPEFDEHQAIPKQKTERIIDMRGDQILEIKDLGQSNNFNVKPTTSLGELILFKKNIYESQKQKIQMMSRKIKLESDQILAFQYEKDQLNIIQNQQYEEEVKLKQLLDYIDKMNQGMSTQDILQTVERMFNISEKFFEEFQIIKLFAKLFCQSYKGVFTAQNFINTALSQKSYFEKAQKLIQKIIKDSESKKDDYLENQSKQKKMKKSELIMKCIIDQTILPVLRSYIVNNWEPQQLNDRLPEIIESWQHIFPQKYLNEQILNALVMQKLQAEAQLWIPSKSLAHNWIWPWLPLTRFIDMKPLFKIIQVKISQNLQKWDINDSMAFDMLAPWFKIFDRQEWNMIFLRCIIPRLLGSLDLYFEINPANQKIDVLQKALMWVNFMDDEQIQAVFETTVIQKLVMVLDMWIDSLEQPNQESQQEIQQWIQGWTELLGKKITNNRFLDDYFYKINKKITNLQN